MLSPNIVNPEPLRIHLHICYINSEKGKIKVQKTGLSCERSLIKLTLVHKKDYVVI